MELPGVTSLHRRDDPGIQVEARDADEPAVATAAVELAAIPGITLPEVNKGCALVAEAMLASK